MDANVRLLDVVALTIDLPEKGLRRGQVGAVVEMPSPGEDQFMVLHYRPERAA
jgi:Domain of unknown function (DUF4926)